MIMDKPSCINELKDLAERLSDRDTNLKECFKKVKSIVNCKKTSPEEKIAKIGEICNGK